MSVNIDKEDLRKALDFFELAKGLPLWFYIESGTIMYDGEWIVNTQTSGYQAIGTGFGCPAYEATRTGYSITVAVNIKMNDDTAVYVFFLEPKKGDFTEFQGFWNPSGNNHKFESNKPGGGAETAIAGQDWTTEHTFTINHTKNTAVRGYINGVLKAEHTNAADISLQPFSIYCCEPNNSNRIMYLKYPPGIQLRNPESFP